MRQSLIQTGFVLFIIGVTVVMLTGSNVDAHFKLLFINKHNLNVVNLHFSMLH